MSSPLRRLGLWGGGVALALLLGAQAASAAPVALALKSAAVEFDALSGQPALRIELTPGAQRSFTKLTTRHVGAILNLIIDGEVVSSPRVTTPVMGSTVMISGNFTASEAAALARRLSDGDAVVTVEPAGE